MAVFGRAPMARGLRVAPATALATVMLLLPGMRSATAADFDCVGFLRMHGLLRRASTACGFTEYNPAIVDRARICFDALGSRRGTEEVQSGVAEFERLRSTRHHDAVCAMLAAKFSMVVRP
ncbi:MULTISPECIES: hypothetical protein [unclassified Methylobacterium]|uniref:hypothetical protein n=1 Tax=unclassified Methylobacterium TaxID=2615210 RepID=UPI0005BC5BDD|nr:MULTISPECIES: hypothetical protein [unclassified Methylobacterium]SFU94445.1 hypothetical protein SAMN02799643_03350 [Methylobacterium sp. UNCCL125]